MVDEVERAMVALSDGQADTSPRVSVRSESGEVMLMGGHLAGSSLIVAKLVGVFMGNGARDLSTHPATICGFDAETGALRFVLDGERITALRTAAVSALSVRLLHPDAERVAIIGTGTQAHAHAVVLAQALGIKRITVSGRTEAKAAGLVTRCAADGLEVRAVADSAEAVKQADVIVTATHAARPVLARAWLAPGTHIASVGVHPLGQEIDDETVAGSAVFVESASTAHEPPPVGSNEIARAVADGRLSRGDIVEIGAVAAGSAPGRRGAEDITLFKSVGSAAADAAVASSLYAQAVEHGIGNEVDMNPQLHTNLHA